MRLGLNLGYWGAGNDAANLALAQEADRLGYAVVWAAEAYGSDAPSMLAWIAGQTHRIDLGAAVMQIPARSPAMTAMTAATIDTLSGGRFRLGLGVSGPQVSEGWHGVRFGRPLARPREDVDIVKLAIGRKPVELDDTGRAQAGRVGERLRALPLAAVVTSPLIRCRQTLELALPDAEPAVDEGLIECGSGDWEGQPLKK